MYDLSVYNPTGSGNVHVDKVISGGRQKVAMPPQFAKAAAAKKAGAKKAAPAKKAAAKANPFAKTMSAPCPPGGGSASGMGAMKKATTKKASKPKAMGEVGTTTRAVKNAITAKTRAGRKLPSQSRIAKGSAGTTGSRGN